MTRAEMRKQAKQDAKKDKVFMLTAQQLEEAINREVDARIRVLYRDKLADDVNTYMDIYRECLICALRGEKFGPMRIRRVLNRAHQIMAELNKDAKKTNTESLETWCDIHNMDAEKTFGVKKSKKSTDEEPIIFLEEENDGSVSM